MRKSILAFSFIALVFFTACGGGGGSSNDTSAPTEASSNIAVAAMMLDPSLAQGLVSSMRTLSDIGLSARQSPTRATDPIDCQGGGTVTLELSSLTSFSSIFDHCVNGSSTLNGTMTMSNVSSSVSSVSGTFEFSNLTVVSGGASTYMDATIQMSAQISGETLSSYDITVNGTIESTAGSYISRETFSNYQMTMIDNAVSIDGTVTLSNTPEVCNTNGTYTIVTVTPITFDEEGNITGGQLTLNGNTYTFNDDKTVTYNNETYNLDALESSCSG